MHIQLNKLSKKTSIIAGVALLLIILSAGLLIKHNTQSSSGSNGAGVVSQAAAQYPNYLEPNDTIQIGQYRYVSPCQVLPLDRIVSVYGQPKGDSVLYETYYDASASGRSSRDTSCRYSLRLGDVQNDVTLRASQYDDIDLFTIPGFVLGATLSDTTAQLEEYKTAARKTDSPAVTTLMSRMQDSIQKFRQTEKSYTEAAVSNFNNYLLPNKGIGSAAGITYKINNVVYQLDIDTRGTGDSTISPRLLTQLARLTESMIENSKNAQLSQAPAPTIIGESDKLGSTRLLEVCDILRGTDVQAVLGTAPSGEVDRSGLDASSHIIDPRPENPDQIYPASSTCRRISETGNRNVVELNLLTFNNAKNAIDHLEGFFSGGKDEIRQIESSASIAYADRDTSEGRMYYFTQGPYLGVFRVNDDGKLATGESGEATLEKILERIRTRAAE